VIDITQVDHIALTVGDIEATCCFYDKLFGSVTLHEHAPTGDPLVRQIRIGGAMLSIHRRGNGIDLVASHPLPGSADICFRVAGSIEETVEQLHRHAIDIVEGPAPRHNSDGLPSTSVYFRDLDGNLIELMALG
jgi:catechol 2,3-dioxygenase-like lactoylglutathione lyase family enzyme